MLHVINTLRQYTYLRLVSGNRNHVVQMGMTVIPAAMSEGNRKGKRPKRPLSEKTSG